MEIGDIWSSEMPCRSARKHGGRLRPWGDPCQMSFDDDAKGDLLPNVFELDGDRYGRLG